MSPTEQRRAHWDRLSAIDSGFWLNETLECPLHIGYVGFVSGEAPPFAEFIQHVSARLGHLPRYRQRVKTLPWELLRPVWVDDAEFDIARHVKHYTLPTACNDQSALDAVAHIVEAPLDFARPLWELWLVDGLAMGEFAVIAKYHHCMMDAVGMVQLAHEMFDGEVDAPQHGASTTASWSPAPEPSAAALFAAAIRSGASLTLRRVSAATRDPRGAMRETARAVRIIHHARNGQADAASQPPSAINAVIGPRRRLVSRDLALDQVKRIQRAVGGSINDVVLTLAMGAVSRLLTTLEPDREPGKLRVHVPVSLRSAEDASVGDPGSHMTVIPAELSSETVVADERLADVMSVMRRYKQSEVAGDIAIMNRISNALSLRQLARMSRQFFSRDAYDILVTNIPGPPVTYVLGRRAIRIVPLPFLAQGHTLTIAVMSYENKLTFGFLVDPQHIHAPERLADYLTSELDYLTSSVLGHVDS